MPTIEITHASDGCREPWSRRSLIRSGLAGLLAPALVAFAVSLIALPFMSVATRHDGIRFE